MVCCRFRDMVDDKIIIEDYTRALRNFTKDGIIDLDNRLKVKFTFQIHRLEMVFKILKGTLPPIRQSHYFLTMVKQGAGQKSVGHFTFPLKKNTLLVVPKRVIHSTKWSRKCTGYVLSFNLDFFLQKAFPSQHIVNKRIFKRSVKPYLNLSKEQAAMLGDIFEYILIEHQGGTNPKNEMIAVKVLELLILCDRYYSHVHSSDSMEEYDETIERFTELLEKNFAEQKTVKFYSHHLHIHPNHLNFLSKKHTGLSAKETISNRVLLEAKYLLTSSNLSIKEIASRLGFEHAESFHTFFKRKEGRTPSGYREDYA